MWNVLGGRGSAAGLPSGPHRTGRVRAEFYLFKVYRVRG